MTAPVPTPEDIRAQYGFVAMLAQAVPEIGQLMQQAVAEKWTAERFQMAVANTGWWKSTPSPVRQWVTQNVADPASASRAMKTGADSIKLYAGRLGFENVDQGTLEKIWLDSQLAGGDEAWMQQHTWNTLYQKNGVPVGGEAGARVQQARELAYAYGYQPSNLDTQIQSAVGAGLSVGQVGDAALSSWQDKLKSYAASKFTPFADRINQGETVMDIAQPYMEMYANTLELNQHDVSLDDKLMQQWLQGKAEGGQPPASVPVWQAQQDLRKDPRWGFTQNARQSAAETATVIGKAFGMIG